MSRPRLEVRADGGCRGRVAPCFAQRRNSPLAEGRRSHESSGEIGSSTSSVPWLLLWFVMIGLMMCILWWFLSHHSSIARIRRASSKFTRKITTFSSVGSVVKGGNILFFSLYKKKIVPPLQRTSKQGPCSIHDFARFVNRKCYKFAI